MLQRTDAQRTDQKCSQSRTKDGRRKNKTLFFIDSSKIDLKRFYEKDNNNKKNFSSSLFNVSKNEIERDSDLKSESGLSLFSNTFLRKAGCAKGWMELFMRRLRLYQRIQMVQPLGT